MPFFLSFRLALSFLSRLPVPCPMIDQPGALAHAMAWFPVAGMVIGGLTGGTYWLACFVLPPILSAVLAVLVGVVITGGLHEDGLADSADGLGARGDRAARLAVMRDSRSGSYGVLALIFSVSLRCGALASIGTPLAGALALLAAHALSRAMIPAVMQILPPARPDGLAAGAGQPDATIAAIAAGIGGGLCLLCLGNAAPWAVLLVVLGCLGVVRLARTHLGGHTGDVLGAVQQVSEMAILLAAAGVLA